MKVALIVGLILSLVGCYGPQFEESEHPFPVSDFVTACKSKGGRFYIKLTPGYISVVCES